MAAEQTDAVNVLGRSTGDQRFPMVRAVTGTYQVCVDHMESAGEASAQVVGILSEPSSEEFVAVFGRTLSGDELPRHFSFIGGLPGEVLEIEVRWSLPRPGRKRARHTPPPSVRILHVLEASAERVTAPCAVFGTCGGCQLQHMAYPAQLAWKAERVRSALRSAGMDGVVCETAGCDDPWHYRNHMRFSVNRDGQAGLTARHSHRVLPLRACPIAHSRIGDTLAVLAEQPLPQPQVVLRYGTATGQMLIHPVPAAETRPRIQALGIEIREHEIEERISGAAFRIRLSSFFQTNTPQAERMAALVLAHLPAGPDVTLVDAYCGVGMFARLMVERADHVIAIEESASAIRDARWNLRDSPNVEIVQAKVEDVLPGMAQRLDGLVIDPPRAGCQRTVLDALIARRVPRVVYVSCNPDSLARDLAYLCREHQAYRLASVQPLDMFPQTAHVESIATLEALP